MEIRFGIKFPLPKNQNVENQDWKMDVGGVNSSYPSQNKISEYEFNEFEPRLKSAKNRFQFKLKYQHNPYLFNKIYRKDYTI